MARAFVGLGGNRRQTPRALRAALRALKKLPGARLAGASRVYRTAPLNCPGAQPDYLNAVAELRATAPPRRVFGRLRTLERRLQKRPRRRNAPRAIDLDYLAHGAALSHGKTLRLPHPRMAARAFVLAPLAELTGKNFAALRNAPKLARALPKTTATQPIRPTTK